MDLGGDVMQVTFLGPTIGIHHDDNRRRRTGEGVSSELQSITFAAALRFASLYNGRSGEPSQFRCIVHAVVRDDNQPVHFAQLRKQSADRFADSRPFIVSRNNQGKCRSLRTRAFRDGAHAQKAFEPEYKCRQSDGSGTDRDQG
jgi:hypothetical protein